LAPPSITPTPAHGTVTANGHSIGLTGGQNHAKIAVTTSGARHDAIFGDLNLQGTINLPHCERGQNGCGRMFFAGQKEDLFGTLCKLVEARASR
jgi:hypothetical protein